MKFYIGLASIAYLMFAINAVIDKFLLRRGIREPAVYAFYIGVLNIAAVLLVPFGVMFPRARIIVIALVSGSAFVYALVAFFKSLQFQDASVVLPAIGGLVPIIGLGLNFFVVGERLAGNELTGLGLLVAGTFLIGSNRDRGSQPKTAWLRWALGAAALFAVSFSMAKIVYNDQVLFISGLVWTRLGVVVGALTMLISPRWRKKVAQSTVSLAPASRWLFLSGQVLGAGAAVLQNYAIKLGSVTVVNALQGTQFSFLFILTILLSRFYPRILREDFSASVLSKKIAAIILISAGLVMIV